MASAEFLVERSTVIDASPDVVQPLLDDFRKWEAWSPWEDVDPDLKRTYSGPDSGVGASYEPNGAGTTVRWQMTGRNNLFFRIVGVVFPMDKMVGKDFEKGLVQLKAAAEQRQ